MTNGTSDFSGFLFDPSIIRNISWSPESQAKFKGGISAHSPGEDLAIRPLHIDDYHKGRAGEDLAPFTHQSVRCLPLVLNIKPRQINHEI